MTFKTSTGLRNHMLTAGSLRSAMDLGNIKIYSGPEPATADSAATGTLLLTYTLNGTATGLSLDTAVSGGIISKPVGAVWNGTIAATGTAGYYRHVGPSDDGTASLTQPRLQGGVATVNAELVLNSIALVAGQIRPLDAYSVALPTF